MAQTNTLKLLFIAILYFNISFIKTTASAKVGEAGMKRMTFEIKGLLWRSSFNNYSDRILGRNILDGTKIF